MASCSSPNSLKQAILSHEAVRILYAISLQAANTPSTALAVVGVIWGVDGGVCVSHPSQHRSCFVIGSQRSSWPYAQPQGSPIQSNPSLELAG